MSPWRLKGTMAELYAIVGGMQRARFMLEARVPYLQLRFKETPWAPHRDEIAEWPRRYPGTRLIVNDDLEFALAVGAWGIHLGQEDLRRYPAERLRAAPPRLGISTHSDREIQIALEAGADMIGFGPIFATGTKRVGHPPQGVARLGEVVRTVSLPVIAIGGIGEENLAAVAATGVSMVAMIGHLDRIASEDQLRRLISRLRTHRALPLAARYDEARHDDNPKHRLRRSE